MLSDLISFSEQVFILPVPVFCLLQFEQCSYHILILYLSHLLVKSEAKNHLKPKSSPNAR